MNESIIYQSIISLFHQNICSTVCKKFIDISFLIHPVTMRLKWFQIHNHDWIFPFSVESSWLNFLYNNIINSNLSSDFFLYWIRKRFFCFCFFQSDCIITLDIEQFLNRAPTMLNNVFHSKLFIACLNIPIQCTDLGWERLVCTLWRFFIWFWWGIFILFWGVLVWLDLDESNRAKSWQWEKSLQRALCQLRIHEN